MNPQQQLTDLKPTKEYFIGFDSDGCVFDTMEIKHKECFCPNYIKYFELQPVSKYAREIWEFVNLYSKNRGCNRFIALIEAFHHLADRSDVLKRKFIVKNIQPLIGWTKAESKLGNPTLEKYAASVNDPFIDLCYEWSVAVNRSIGDMVYGISPFPYVNESLEAISGKADAIVVSQTPVEALEREWEENNIDHYVRVIAGQEFGTKTEHIKFAAKGKYPPDKILMIGDAPGDLKAANANDALFFPIKPGKEDESWEQFYKEGVHKFFDGSFKGAYQLQLLEEFEKFLPEKPSWDRVAG